MNSARITIKIVPPTGASVYRLHFGRRHLVVLVVGLALVLSGLVALHEYQLRAASAAVKRLQAERLDQQRKLEAMERQTQALQKQTTESERSIERIERTLGARRESSFLKLNGAAATRTLPAQPPTTLLAERLVSLEQASAQTRLQARRLSGLARRILNVRRLASIARDRLIAAIPSLNPVNGGINAAFGWRTDPFPEFHKGLDLAADYGTIVRASAAGIVTTAAWAGDYGIKVDIDHGNGYHTWYCHLSRVTVVAGQHVAKGQAIAKVGSTGESTGPHLHYQVMRDGLAVDPLPFLHGVPANVMATLPRDPRVL